MKKIAAYISVILLAMISFQGCIKNDIPYPHLDTEFLTFSVTGEERAANINPNTRTITLYLPETVDIEHVKVSEYSITPDAEVVSPDLNETLDLSSPLTAVLHLYYDYEWTITAQQSIERYFTVENQIGASEIDEANHAITFTVPESVSLSSIKVLTMKLGPAKVSTYSPNITGATTDFTQPLSVNVSYFDKQETWTITAIRSQVSVAMTRVDAWTKVIWAYASGEAGKDAGIQYRVKGSTTWIDADKAHTTIDGGEISCRISGLQETTTYEVRAWSGDKYSDATEATTEGIITIPNMMLDQWHKVGKVWYPWAEGGEQYWDTGNKGATTLGDSNVTPADGNWQSDTEGTSASLQTKFVGLASIGKLAAGSIYTGEFVKVDGTNGILNFGRPFTGRPTRLHGYIKYHSATINYASSELATMKGQPDTASVYMALTDWPEPFEIRTNPRNRQLFDPESSDVIAYGALYYGHDIENYTEFTVELDYRDTYRVPKYVVIVCAASKYGDYFTGGTGSVLNVSNLWLDWDY